MNYLTFAFDDGYQSWVKAGELLEDHRYRGVFYTCLRNVVHSRTPSRKRMFPQSDIITWKELKNLQDNGHEIASHGTRHVDLPKCNQRELHMEIVDSLEVFRSHGINTSTYGCSFNAYSQQARNMVLRHYGSFRNHLGVNEMPPKSRTYSLLPPQGTIEALTSGKDGWVVSVRHDVNTETFDKYLDKIDKLDITTITVREAYNRK